MLFKEQLRTPRLVRSAIPDILNFTPVQRRAHVNGWREEHQHAFIAALAITGSPRQAARAIGRHAFGAEQLRNHRSGKGFAAACDAAMELARERELHRIHDNIAGLARNRDDQLDGLVSSSPGRGRLAGGGRGEGAIHPDCDYDPDIHTDDYPEYWEAKRAIRERLTKARRLLLFLIRDDEDKRQAWETLVGPVDWDRADRLGAQDDEPFHDPGNPTHAGWNMTQPDMLLTAEAGLLPDIAGGHDLMADLMQQAEAARSESSAPSLPGEGDRPRQDEDGGGAGPTIRQP